MSIVPDSIKINTSTRAIKGSQDWHPGRGTKASSLVKRKGLEEIKASIGTHLLSLCSAVSLERCMSFDQDSCVLNQPLSSRKKEKVLSAGTGVITYLSFSKCFMKFGLSSQKRN